MRIQHNIMAMNAYRNYNTNNKALSGNLEKLSSGYKINRAGDDAAGLAISEKMRAQITGLNAAQKNVKDGISLVKTAEGAMQEIQDMLNRMDYLATQSANGTYDNEVDRLNLQKEVDALKTEINRIADSANFNGIKLLDGSQAGAQATNAQFAISAAGTYTAGTALMTGATYNPASSLFSTTADGIWGTHETQPNNTQATASFTIDLRDMVVKNSGTGAASIATVTLSFGSINTSITFGGGAAASMSATELAASFAAATWNITGSAGLVSIGGMVFEMSASGSEITFTVSTDHTGMDAYTSAQADAANALIKGATVNVTATVAGASATIESDWDHGLEKVTYAKEANNGKLAGISLTLDGSIVKDGFKLSIGDNTFVFKTQASGSLATAASGETLIDVSTFSGSAQWAEAARQMALGANYDVTHSGTVNGTTGATPFRISLVSGSGNVIHVDQKKVTTGTDKEYKEADLQKLFVVTEPTTNEAAGSLSVTVGSMGISGAPSVGDVYTVDGKTYTIVADDDKNVTKAANYDSTSNIKITADDFKTQMDNYSSTKLEKAVEDAKKEFGSKFDFTLASDKKSVSVALNSSGTKGVDDDAATMKAIYDKLMNGIGIESTKVGAGGASGLTLQIGDTSDKFNQMSVKIGDMHTYAMGTGKTTLDGEEKDVTNSIADIDISSQSGAQEAVAVIKNAINYVSGIRGDLGAIQNRLDHTANNLSVMAENIQDAESTIRDTDVAEEMMSYVKNNILVQSAQAMLAQANQVPQGVLQLLG